MNHTNVDEVIKQSAVNALANVMRRLSSDAKATWVKEGNQYHLGKSDMCDNILKYMEATGLLPKKDVSAFTDNGITAHDGNPTKPLPDSVQYMLARIEKAGGK